MAITQNYAGSIALFSKHRNVVPLRFKGVTSEEDRKVNQYVGDLKQLIQEYPDILTQFDESQLRRKTELYLKAKKKNPALSYVIGITGGSASGKSTLCGYLANLLEKMTAIKPALLPMDKYYRDYSEKRKNLEVKDFFAAINLDTPWAFLIDLLSQHLANLRQGQRVKIPDYVRSKSTLDHTSVAPAPITLAEGTMLFADEDLREQFDLTLFVDLPDDIRKERWEERWNHRMNTTSPHMQTVDKESFFSKVQDGYERFIEPWKQKVMILLSNEGPPHRMELFMKELEKVVRRLLD